MAEAEAARPAPGAVEILGALARRFALVAVVSGRPVSFLHALMPAGVRLTRRTASFSARDERGPHETGTNDASVASRWPASSDSAAALG